MRQHGLRAEPAVEHGAEPEADHEREHEGEAHRAEGARGPQRFAGALREGDPHLRVAASIVQRDAINKRPHSSLVRPLRERYYRCAIDRRGGKARSRWVFLNRSTSGVPPSRCSFRTSTRTAGSRAPSTTFPPSATSFTAGSPRSATSGAWVPVTLKNLRSTIDGLERRVPGPSLPRHESVRRQRSGRVARRVGRAGARGRRAPLHRQLVVLLRHHHLQGGAQDAAARPRRAHGAVRGVARSARGRRQNRGGGRVPGVRQARGLGRKRRNRAEVPRP